MKNKTYVQKQLEKRQMTHIKMFAQRSRFSFVLCRKSNIVRHKISCVSSTVYPQKLPF